MQNVKRKGICLSNALWLRERETAALSLFELVTITDDGMQSISGIRSLVQTATNQMRMRNPPGRTWLPPSPVSERDSEREIFCIFAILLIRRRWDAIRDLLIHLPLSLAHTFGDIIIREVSQHTHTLEHSKVHTAITQTYIHSINTHSHTTHPSSSLH